MSEPHPGDLVRSLDTITGALASLSAQPPEGREVFHDALCEAVCSLTSIRRAVIFLWDAARRHVRIAGSHDVDISVFDERYVNVDVLPAARLALERDEVVESRDHGQAAERFGALVRDRKLVVTPMVAAGRWVGVVVGDRLPDAPELTDGERRLLWSLGKTAALAATAQGAARQALRARELEERIDLARELHEGVVQRLFGVSMALDGPGALDAEVRRRCSEELHAALGELRETLQRPLGRAARPVPTSLSGVFPGLVLEHADIGLRLAADATLEIPAHLDALVQSVVREAVRNARKHAEPSFVELGVRRREGTLVATLTNDGVGGSSGRSGMGLRLAALEALQHGGLLEFGPLEGGRWQVRLAVPDG